MRVLCVIFCVLCLTQFNGSCHKTKRRLKSTCGGLLTARHGVIQTPAFPARFPVPIRCQWIIDASNVPTNNATIVVYLTQLYVLKGLSFTEYAFYDSTARYGERLIHSVTEQNVVTVRWIQPKTMFLVIDFQMKELEGNQLRALGGLLDVYGFNITYEISTDSVPVRTNTCNVEDCSFVGHCYTARDFSQFWCSCFEGFSGAQCGQGPLCEADRSHCQNGATCRHAGANSVTCYCPPGYNGSKCDIQTSLLDEINACDQLECRSQCIFNGKTDLCNCPKDQRISIDRTRFEGIVQLTNSPNEGRRQIEVVLERQLTKYLKSFNISQMDDLKVINISSGAEVMFHFFGMKKDGGKVREALNRLVERGRLGNLSFVPTRLVFRQEPTLILQTIQVNRQKTIREGDEFILSCKAQGSTNLKFKWFKDGVIVKPNRAIRKISISTQSVDPRDHYISQLYIPEATPFDDGIFTCQVEDWGAQQCKSIHIEVRKPPIVEVFPKSITVQKGDNVSIVCISTNDQQPNVFGYSWTKNKILFKMKSGTEVWEELYPSGSILKINNIQVYLRHVDFGVDFVIILSKFVGPNITCIVINKSTIYSCEVISYVTTTIDVRVEVLNKSIVPLCLEEKSYDVTWPETSPGVYCIINCPVGFSGNTRRLCTLRNINQVDWDLPDFSNCISEYFLTVSNNFRRLTSGYQITTPGETMDKYLNYVSNRGNIFPGEGEQILNLVQEVVSYVNNTRTYMEVLNTTQSLYQVIDLILKKQDSIIDVTKVMELQKLLRNQVLISGSQLKISRESHFSFDTFNIHIINLDNGTRDIHIPLTQNSSIWWNTEKIDVRYEHNPRNSLRNSSVTLGVIIYNNLPKFLPKRSAVQLRNGVDFEYEIISHLVSVSLGYNRRLLSPDPGTLWLNLEIQHDVARSFNWEARNATCAVADVAGSNWDLDACSSIPLGATLTRCTCTRAGVLAVLLIAKPQQITINPRVSQPIVLFGCVCCLVQSLVTMGVLLLYWWYHQSCLVYLKVQCCGATVGAMAVFLYAICNHVSAEFNVYITTLLEIFLLIGMSSHLSKILIVYTELFEISKVRRIKLTVVVIITGVPFIAIFGSHLAHRSIGRVLDAWWLLFGTLVFNIFIISSSVIFILFVFIYLIVMRRLQVLVTKHLTNSKGLAKRIGMLRRSGLVLVSMVVMTTSSILYVNQEHIMYHYIFSTSCAVLGFLQLVCYVINSENSVREDIAQKLRLHTAEDEDFSSESANNPLNFFTKQDPELENENIPPKSHIDASQQLAKQTTYLHSIPESDLESKDGQTNDVDLELYNSSPKTYRKSPVLYKSEKIYLEHLLLPVVISPTTGHYSHPPDILTTGVCVELDLLPTSTTNETKFFLETQPIPSSSLFCPQPPEIIAPQSSTTCEENPPESNDNLDGMLNRISHDLDYLLNKIPELEQLNNERKTGVGYKTGVCDQINEESDERQQLE